MAQPARKVGVVAYWRALDEHQADPARYARRAVLALVEPSPSISPPPPPAWGESMTPGAASPGRGRRTRIPSAFGTQATKALKAELGEPTIRTQRGSTLQVWEVAPDGDGIVCARLSSEDLDKGETAMGQVHGLRDLAERLDLRVRYIVVALRTSGVPDMDDRPDFEFLRDRIAQGRIAWVGYRHPDRVARHTYPAEAFYRYLEKAGVDLYLTSFGRKVDWVADRFSLLMHSVVSEQERNQIVNRLQDGRIRRWLETAIATARAREDS